MFTAALCMKPKTLMSYRVLACDYDETLAHGGVVTEATLAALERLLGSGRKPILVTGRQLEELLDVFPEAHRFERIVAENGALLYDPKTGQTRTLAEPPAAGFTDALRQRDVSPLAVGRVIMATKKPHEKAVWQAIRALGLDLQVILNKDSVMVLPTGVDKETGLATALRELNVSFRDVIGIGDGENDEAFLSLCGYAVAVQNAVPAVKKCAHLVTADDDGAGVVQVINRLIENDLP